MNDTERLGRGRLGRALLTLQAWMTGLPRHLVAVVSVFFLVSGAQAQSDPSAVAQGRGLDWLQAQVGSDGALGGEAASVAVSVQVRSEAALTLVQAGRSVPAALQQSLLTNSGAEAEPLARKVVALRAAGADAGALEDSLRSLQRSDGGVGATVEAGSSALDTAWALRALAGDVSRSDQAAAWLRQRQLANGAWEVAPRSVLLSTAIALRGLREIASRNAEAAAAAGNAANYLLAQRSGNALWDGGVWLNALVFDAVHDYVTADAPLRTLVRDALLGAQSADGSWGGDPYATALALRALRLTVVAPSNPVLGVVRGRTLDAASGAPLQGVTVLLDGAATGVATDTNGSFELRNLAVGSHTLALQLANYGQVQAPLTVSADQTIDLGVISMVQSAGTTTGTIRGQVLDATTGLAIPAATVIIDSGAIATSTTADGSYFIANAPVGAHTITVSMDGYQGATATGTIAAGETLVFSPRLVRSGEQAPAGNGVLVEGTVVHAGTGAPLAGASVSIVLIGEDASGQTMTDANGQFAFTSIPRTSATSGLVGIGVQLDGYATQTLTTNMPSNVGTLRMVPADPRQLLADLFPSNVNKSNVVTDAQRNIVSGYVTFDVINLGQSPAPVGVTYTAFEDRNRNGRYDAGADLALGVLQHEQALAPSAVSQLRIDVAGAITFRGNQILVAADTENVAIEGNEDNNIARCECLFGLPYIEDFDDGVANGVRYIGNQAGQLTTWTVADGYLSTSGGGGALFGQVEWADYDAEVKVFFVGSVGNDAALVFRAATDNSWYHLRFKQGHSRLVSSINGSYAIPVEVPYSVQPNRWYTLKAKVRGNVVEAIIDDVPVFTYSNVQIPAGRVGVMTDAGGTVRFDDLRVFGDAVPTFVDLTASYVRVLDAGASGTSRITVRVGNGGTATVPAGANVTLYRGTPSSANRVQTVQTTVALGSSEYQDIDFNIAGGLAGMGQVTIVVDDSGSGVSLISECDEANNSIQAELGQLAVQLTVTAATSEPRYTELDTALFTATVGNAGSFSQSAQVRFAIEAVDGQPVQTLPLPAAAAVASGSQANVQSAWPVLGVVAGDYRVRAELLNSSGVVFASAVAPFRVEASNSAHVGARVMTDRVQYTAAQSVQLKSQVLNATANMLIDGLVATTELLGAGGQSVWLRSEPPLQLVARNSREFTYTVAASGLPPGSYTALLNVRDSLGNLQSSSSAQFTVLGTDFSGVGLRGVLEVPSTLAIGQTAALGYSVVNGGNAALTGVPLTLRLVDPQAAALRGEFALSATLGVGASQAGAVNWQASGQVGDVVAVLTATIGGREQVLAQAPFKLSAAQTVVDLAAVARTDRDARVLVLMSCPVSGVDDANCVAQRSAAVTSMLGAIGVPFRVVTTAQDFEAEMRCGIYNVYWISGGAAKLSDQASRELREAVRHGDGLILDGPQNGKIAQDDRLQAVAGVHQWENQTGQNYTIQVQAGTIFEPGPLATLGQPAKFVLTTGQPVAMFNQYYPAIVINRYGLGGGVVLAFDYAAMLAAPGGLTDTRLRGLLEDALDTVTFAPTGLTLADVGRLVTEVENRAAQAVDIEVRASLPTGVSYLDAQPVPYQVVPAGSSTPAQVIWRLNLLAGGLGDFKLRYRVDGASVTSVNVPVSVYSRLGTEPVLQQTVTHAPPVADGWALTEAAYAAIQALAPTSSYDQANRGYAVNAATAARQRYQQGDYAGAISKWMAAAELVANITTDDVARIAAAQLAIAMANEAATDRLCRP